MLHHDHLDAAVRDEEHDFAATYTSLQAALMWAARSAVEAVFSRDGSCTRAFINGDHWEVWWLEDTRAGLSVTALVHTTTGLTVRDTLDKLALELAEISLERKKADEANS